MQERTLKFKLIVGGALIVLLPLVILGIVIEIKTSNAMEETAQSQMLASAKATAEMVNIALSSELKMAGQIAAGQNVAAATATAIQNGLVDADIASLNAVLKNIQGKHSDYDAILVTDKDGKVIADSQDGSYKANALSGSPAFPDAIGGKATIGDVTKSKSGNPVLAVLAPVVTTDGTTVGILNVYVSLKNLNTTVTTKIGETGYGYAVDRKGLLVLHPDPAKILATNIFELAGMEDIAKGMKARQSGVEKYTFTGIKKMAGYAPVTAGGWTIGITQNQAELYGPARSIRNFILLISLISIVLAIGGLFFFTAPLILPIKNAAQQVTAATDVVSSSSTQLSAASHTLAEGVSEQAASLEETSSSLEEIASIARQTAENSMRAGDMMREAQGAAKKVIECLGGLTTSMQDVSASSEQTSRIVKNIDEIAFQTNLLALNAAVEAARAGEAGAGFAVVAEEVRNLALRAAESAKNTAGMIEDTVAKIKQGVDLVQKTNEAFGALGKYRAGVTDLIDQVTGAAKEQAEGVEQVNRAVAEMDKVTQQTAATAEESASTAAELNAQAEVLTTASLSLLTIVEGSTNHQQHPQNRSIQTKHPSRALLPAPDKKNKTITQLAKALRSKPAKKMFGTQDEF
jgi:methyl-accepting chemotaxis protein